MIKRNNSHQQKIVKTTASISMLFLAAMFLFTWIKPTALGVNQVSYLTVLIMVEIILAMAFFFIIPVLVTLPKGGIKNWILGFIIAFFSLFIIIITVINHEYYYFFIVMVAAFTRILSIRALTQDGTIMLSLIVEWIASIIILLLTCIIALGFPMPELGLTPEVLASIPSLKDNSSNQSSVFIDHPESAMAFGVIYFSAMALTYKLRSRLQESFKVKFPVLSDA